MLRKNGPLTPNVQVTDHKSLLDPIKEPNIFDLFEREVKKVAVP